MEFGTKYDNTTSTGRRGRVRSRASQLLIQDCQTQLTFKRRLLIQILLFFVLSLSVWSLWDRRDDNEYDWTDRREKEKLLDYHRLHNLIDHRLHYLIDHRLHYLIDHRLHYLIDPRLHYLIDQRLRYLVDQIDSII